MSCGVGTPPSFLPARPPLVSSRMMSMQSSTHSSQMNTVGPAISLRTSCWLLPQKEQYRVFFESPPLLPLTLLISLSFQHAGHLLKGETDYSTRSAILSALTRENAALSGVRTGFKQPRLMSGSNESPTEYRMLGPQTST